MGRTRLPLLLPVALPPLLLPLLLSLQELAGASGASRAELEKTSKERQGTVLWRAPELFVMRPPLRRLLARGRLVGGEGATGQTGCHCMHACMHACMQAA